MLKIEDLHIGDKVKTNISDKDALIVKIESNAYINYQKNVNREENKYSKALIPFLNDDNTYQGIMYNNITLKIDGQDMLIGTNISNIISVIKTDNNLNKSNNSLIKRFLSLFGRH